MKHRHTIAGAIVLALGTASGSAAPDPRYVPPPGLYQIELVSAPAGAPQQRATPVAGSGSQRVCIRPLQDASKELMAQGCKVDKGQVIGGQMVSMSSCPWGRVRTSMRQVDPRTWETTVETAMKRAPTAGEAAGSMAFMRTMAEKMAKSSNPQERAEGQKSLAYFTQMEAELKKLPQEDLQEEDLPQEAATMNSQGAAPLEKKAVTRMTRVGDCKG